MKMSLIVFGALAVSFLIRRRSAALRHWVLAAGVAGAAAVPLLTAVVPVWPLPFATPTAFTSYEDPFRESGLSGEPRAGDTGRGASTVSGAVGPTMSPDGIRFGAVLQSMWVAGTVVGLAILLTGMLRLAWLAAHARRITDGRWHDLAEEIARGYGLTRPVLLLQSSHQSLLVTWGFARPKVILPAAADGWTEERARVVLSHELAHIRRGDWIVQVSAEVLRAFYWFNPLLWVACRRLRLESEHACDDEVMSRGVDGPDYATHLIELARSLNRRPAIWFPAPAMARPSSLERRVRAMLNRQLDRGPISGATRSAIVVLLFLITAVVAAAQSGFVSLSGRVTDEQGRGVQAVAVALVNDARQAKYEVKTNTDGQFEFVGLPAGEYGLEATGSGFQALKDVVTVSGQNLQRSYTLKLGTLQETIIVTDDGREHHGPTVKERAAPPRAACTPSGTGGPIRPPRKIRDVAPSYPPTLRGTGTSGLVNLKGRIALDGYLTDISVEGEAQPDMASSAVAAVREWQFTETLLNCQPVDVVMNIAVTFKGMSQAAVSAPK